MTVLDEITCTALLKAKKSSGHDENAGKLGFASLLGHPGVCDDEGTLTAAFGLQCISGHWSHAHSTGSRCCTCACLICEESLPV